MNPPSPPHFPPASGSPPHGAPPPHWIPPSLQTLEPQAPGWPKILGGIAVGIGLYGLIMHGWGLFTARAMPASNPIVNATTAAQSPTIWEDLARYQMMNGIGCLLVGILLIAGGITLLRKRPIARGLLLTWAVLRIAVAGLTAPAFYTYSQSMMSGALPPALLPAAPAAAPASPAPLTGTLENPLLLPDPASSAPPTETSPATPAAAPGESGNAPPGQVWGSFTIRPSLPATPPGGAAAPTPPINLSALMSGIALASFIFGLLLSCLLPLLTLVWFNLAKVRLLIDSWNPRPASNPPENAPDL